MMWRIRLQRLFFWQGGDVKDYNVFNTPNFLTLKVSLQQLIQNELT